MLLADRGFVNQQLLQGLGSSRWQYCLRLPCDVIVKGARRYPTPVGVLYPQMGKARLYRQVRLWVDGTHSCNLVLATVQGAKDAWAVATDESPSLETLWQYALRFRVEELFLNSKSGAFELEVSNVRSAPAFERLYLVAAIALLFATTHGMTVHLAVLRQQVDPHWQRGLSYLKIGLRWLNGVLHKGRKLLMPVTLLPQDPQPGFASKRAERKFYDQFWFSRIRSLTCS